MRQPSRVRRAQPAAPAAWQPWVGCRPDQLAGLLAAVVRHCQPAQRARGPWRGGRPVGWLACRRRPQGGQQPAAECHGVRCPPAAAALKGSGSRVRAGRASPRPAWALAVRGEPAAWAAAPVAACAAASSRAQPAGLCRRQPHAQPLGRWGRGPRCPGHRQRQRGPGRTRSGRRPPGAAPDKEAGDAPPRRAGSQPGRPPGRQAPSAAAPRAPPPSAATAQSGGGKST